MLCSREDCTLVIGGMHCDKILKREDDDSLDPSNCDDGLTKRESTGENMIRRLSSGNLQCYSGSQPMKKRSYSMGNKTLSKKVSRESMLATAEIGFRSSFLEPSSKAPGRPPV